MGKADAEQYLNWQAVEKTALRKVKIRVSPLFCISAGTFLDKKLSGVRIGRAKTRQFASRVHNRRLRADRLPKTTPPSVTMMTFSPNTWDAFHRASLTTITLLVSSKNG
ncbi:MAG TPA: hypothetical protein DD473_15895 [Planctomycetaceae bacterium]|nr:hypothetical protein [Planctomycetaceae bacterium]